MDFAFGTLLARTDRCSDTVEGAQTASVCALIATMGRSRRAALAISFSRSCSAVGRLDSASESESAAHEGSPRADDWNCASFAVVALVRSRAACYYHGIMRCYLVLPSHRYYAPIDLALGLGAISWARLRACRSLIVSRVFS